jgi:prolyl oligopeptidase
MRSLPVPTRREDIVDRLHGVDVADPYRWLEIAEDPAVSAWIDAQNALLERTLAEVAVRERLRARLGELLQIGSISVPQVRRTRTGGTRLFFSRREGRQDQPVLYVRDGVRGGDRTLFDPNPLSLDGTLSLDWYEPSEDGALLAYGTSQGGSEDSTLRIRDVATGKDLPDVIEGTRHASIAWLPDGKRFFYTRYPKPGSVPSGEERYHRRIYEHQLGRAPDADPLIFGAELPPTDFPNCQVSPDGRWLVVSVSRGWNETELHVADLAQAPRTFRRVTPPGKNRYFALPRRDALYVVTNEGAPRYQVFRADPREPARERWQPLLAEHPSDVIGNLEIVGRELLVSYQGGGISRLERFDLSGKSRGPIPLPTLGTSDGFSGLPDGSEAFYNFESFAAPPVIHRIDLPTSKTEVWETVRADLSTADFLVSELDTRSRDGTRIPYRVVRHRSVALDSGKNPVLLYGYGGFNERMQPRFSRSSYAFLERGGVYVQAVLRGGGEFGESWHRAGQLENKQNTFDDFIAVAEDLIQRKVTDREHLAIHGRSNGGLLVAAAITQRPDLFRAAIAGVPLTDMIRYPEFLIAKLWVPEYGSPEDEQQFATLLAYSPYHHVRPAPYPAVLVTTAESDTRVDPLHARKFVAALQHATESAHPVLLRTERKAGHGAGTPVSKLVAELTDLYAFLFSELGMIETLSP